MNNFNIYIELDEKGNIPNSSKTRIIKYIELLKGNAISFIWMYNSKKISFFSILSLIKFERKFCSFAGLIVKNCILINNQNISYMAKKTLTKFRFSIHNGNQEIVNKDIIKLAFNNNPKSCEFNSCLGKTIVIYKNDQIGICPFIKNKITLNNNLDINNVKLVFNTDSFYELISNSIKKRNICKNKCEYYYLCKSGCPLKSIKGNCDILSRIKNVDKDITKDYYKEQIIEKLSSKYK